MADCNIGTGNIQDKHRTSCSVRKKDVRKKDVLKKKKSPNDRDVAKVNRSQLKELSKNNAGTICAMKQVKQCWIISHA